MYTLAVKAHFDAAHSLRGYEGKCAGLHGHRWTVEAAVSAARLGSLGMAMDFRHLREMLQVLVERFDHQHLNEIPPFDMINPTAEAIARICFEALERLLPEGVSLVRVTVWESPDCWASYDGQ